MDFKQKAQILLTHHKFQQGMTVNTRDWNAKSKHEIRISEGGFIHYIINGGKMIPKSYITRNVKVLEDVIFKNNLNVKFERFI